MQVPKRKPDFLKNKKKPEEKKPDPQPKKFVAFSPGDNYSLEAAYQTILEETENERSLPLAKRKISSGSRHSRTLSAVEAPNTSIEATAEDGRHDVRVPVNEDFLFDVDIESRELAPVYWLGPIYEGIATILPRGEQY